MLSTEVRVHDHRTKGNRLTHDLQDEFWGPRCGGRPVARLGLLISDSGECCLGIGEAIRSGALSGCEIGVVISNMTGAPGIEAARTAGYPVVVMEGRGREQRDHENAISTLLRTYRVDLVCLAGYLRVLSARFTREWRGKILSSHLSLLPAFPGQDPAGQALTAGVQFTGCTVQFLEETTDAGLIVTQRVVAVQEDDTAGTLHSRLAAEERLAYADAIGRVLSGEYEAAGHRYLPRTPKSGRDAELDENPVETVMSAAGLQRPERISASTSV